MSVLYSCVGTTDPIRKFRDGGLLHIVRHYKPEKVYLYISHELMRNEIERQWYTIPIKAVHPSCEIHVINSGVTDVHNVDSLHSMVDYFYNILEDNPGEDILINVTSGTPQMQLIMALLVVENPNVKGIQVDTPSKGPNFSDHERAGDSILELVELNEDNELTAPNRCHEPALGFVRKKSISRQIEALIDNYNYEAAFSLYKQNRRLFDDLVGKLLEHAYLREHLHYDKACEKIKRINRTRLENYYTGNLSNLWEYLLVMDIRVKQENYQDFFIRMTPFLYELFWAYLFDIKKVRYEQVGERDKKGGKKLWVHREKLQNHFPKALRALDNSFAKSNEQFKNRTSLSFVNMIEIVCNNDSFCVPETLESQLRSLRSIEEKIRNKLAHTIVKIDLKSIKEVSDNKTPRDICSWLYDLFFFVAGITDGKKQLIYNQINEEIKEIL